MDAPEAMGQTPGGFAGFTEMWDLYKPVIAAVNGHTIGGGFEIALASDIVIAVDWAEFWLPEMERGFLPDAGAVQTLAACAEKSGFAAHKSVVELHGRCAGCRKGAP